MAGRHGFFGGLRTTDAPERDADSGFDPDALSGSPPLVRLGDPSSLPRGDTFGTPPTFDPVWGSLGAPLSAGDDDSYGQGEDEAEGLAVEVEILGNGFEVSGQIQTGQFDRLSDWINMQAGYVAVRDALHVRLGQTHIRDSGQCRGTLWVRLSQIVLMAERSGLTQVRPGAPVVQKQRRRVSIVTPGYMLQGNIHVHAHGSMYQFLESPDPHFLPVTDLTVRWLSDAALVARFTFAMINREQLVTLLDEPRPPVARAAQTEARSA